MKGRFTFLGTGTSTGIPEIGCECPTCCSQDPRDKRLRASALLECGDTVILIDCGPDFRAQMLREGISRLDAILTTHEHYDHVGGIDDIRPLFYSISECPIYAEKNVIAAIRTRMPYAFGEHKYPGVPRIELRELYPLKTLRLRDNLEILPLRVMHGQLPIVGFRIGSLAYITDCKTLPKESLDAIQGIDTLILNSLRLYPHPAHIHLEEALSLIEYISPRRTFLTHFAHTFGPHIEIEKILPRNVSAGYDGLSFEFEYSNLIGASTSKL